MNNSNVTRMPCCVCGDPWTLDAPDYVTVILQAPDDGMTQYLGAHAGCLARVFTVQVEAGDPDPGPLA